MSSGSLSADVVFSGLSVSAAVSWSFVRDVVPSGKSSASAEWDAFEKEGDCDPAAAAGGGDTVSVLLQCYL